MNPDFRDMIFALSDCGAEYMIVGGYALAAHHVPRMTVDIDIWVRPTRENAERVRAALVQFGAPMDQFDIDGLCEEGNVYQIGLAPRRIDLMTSIEGVDFDAAWTNRISFEYEGRSFPAIGRAELIQNKLATGRDQDRLDAKRLIELDDDGDAS